jgi:hypothetical protein
MSNQPENDLFDLENLFAPAWAKEPAAENRYSKYEGREETPERGERRGGRHGGFGGPRREGGGPRPSRGSGGPAGPRFGGRRSGEGEGERRGGRPGVGGQRRDDRGGPSRTPRPAPEPLPEVTVALVPDAGGVEMLARQIRMTGRAYPLFQIALMILEKPERHSVTFGAKKGPEGKVLQPLYSCALDESLWLSEDEVIAHILRHHLATFYQAERTQTDPPKGKYTFVAQCGLSGVILGPPNHHDYQKKLQELHAQRFARMPFDVFKARVKIVKDEAVVAKWVEDQSWKTEYICLNIPDAPKLATMEDVENHFRAVHASNMVKPVESITISGKASRNLRSQGLARLYRLAVEDQRRFPLQIATTLSQQFAQHGLQFFKVNKTITHVSVARPKYLDLETTPVSNGVKRIVEFINAQKKCTRRELVETLAPTPVTAIPVTPPATADQTSPAGATTPEAAKPAATEPTPEQTAVISDLHWLIHQGHVIEFATTGILETAKKPIPKPPKPAKTPIPTAEVATPSGEVVVEAKPEDSFPSAAEAHAAAAPGLEAAPEPPPTETPADPDKAA